MAADAEKLRAQALRIQQLRKAKERREGKTISQETAAYEIGVSSRTYRTWEGSGATLKEENLQALAKYFDADPNLIEHGEPEELSTPDLSSGRTQLDQIQAELGAIRRQLAIILEAKGDSANFSTSVLDDITTAEQQLSKVAAKRERKRPAHPPKADDRSAA